MAAHEAKTATDLQEIKKWAEKRGGKPAKVKGVGSGEDGDGLIRIDFPGYNGGDSLQEISWEEWYEIFQDRELAFLLVPGENRGWKRKPLLQAGE